MNKNTIFIKRLKRTLSAVTVIALMITLAGCTSTADKYPMSGIDANETYATNGSHKITNGALYTELRHGGLGYLNQQIELATFDDYVQKVDINDADQKELVAEYILTDIYGTFDEEEISDIKVDDKTLAVTKYVDVLFSEGIVATSSDLNGKYTTTEILNIDSFDSLFNNKYTIKVAQYLYAVDRLNEKIEDHNDEAAKDDDMDVYFNDKKIADYYDNNYSFEGEVDAIIIRFFNQDEANNVLRKFGIKTYNGEWFLIQPPKDKDGNTDFSKWTNESDYNKYYDEYTINQNADESADATITAASGTEATTLKLFVAMYNYIYTYRSTLTHGGTDVNFDASSPNFRKYYDYTTNLINSDNQLADKKSEKDTVLNSLINQNNSFITFDKDKLDTYSSSLTTYVHNTLKADEQTDDDGNVVDSVQYTASARSYGSNYYLMYKLSDADQREFYTIEEDEETGEEYYDFKLTDENGDSNDENQEIYDEILAELFDAELTTSYIDTVVAERNEFVTVSIYDSVFEFYYSQANAGYSNTKKTSDSLVAKITFKDKANGLEWNYEVSVVDAFTYLEASNGPETAVALLFNEFIKDSTYYSDIEDDKENYDTYKESINYTLTNFANDSYASYGYPASIGKYTFMQAYYRTAIIDEAIAYLTLQDAKREFFIENTNTSAFFTEMESFANTAYANYYSLTLTSIQVYVDMDEDGKADLDWFSKNDSSNTELDPEFRLNITEKNDLVNELIEEIISYAKTSTANLETSLSDAVNEFNSSTRIVPSEDDDKLNGNVEKTWAKYRQHGLYISVSAIGEHNNTTELEPEVQQLVKELYENEDGSLEIMQNNKFTTPYLITEEENFKKSEDGSTISLLLVTSGNGKTEINFEDEDEELYVNVPIKIDDSYKLFDLSSTKKEANLAQIEVYCREYFATGSSTSLPGEASAYLNAYLDPILTKYNSEVVQLMIMMNTLDVTFADANCSARLDSFVSYAQRLSDNYVDTTSEDSTSNFKGFWSSDVLFKGGAN